MSSLTLDPRDITSEPKPYYVLVMTAAVLTGSEMEAAQRALIEGPPALDPKQLQWFVRFVSDKPIELSEDVLDTVTEEGDAPVEG